MSHELVDPRGTPSRRDPGALAPRLGSVPDHLELGFLVNEVSRQTGPDFTRYTELMEDVLRARSRRLDVVREAKTVLSRPAPADQLRRFVHCRGVVTGLAK